jgi:hypothetical protein
MKKRIVITLMLFTMLFAGIAQAATVITPDNPNIQYRGRWDFSSPSAPWCHAKSCTIIVNFQGTSIAADFSNSSIDEYIRVIIDDDAPGSVKISTPSSLTTLASGLSDSNHKIEIVKETDNARITFNGFELDDGKSLNPPPARPPRKIEFYGDSNQAGDSSESERNDGDKALRGNYYTYPGYISRMFDAEYINFSKSGSTISSTDTAHVRIDWSSSTPLWDFNNFQADLVVVNVGANDHGPDKKKKADYHAFLDDLRAEHPNAHIMLYNAFGWSTSEPANFIHEVIAERGDPDMSSHIFPWVFAQWHGCQYDHSGMAMYLADHLQATLGWTPVAPLDVFSGFGRDGDVANGSFEEVAPFGGWGWRYFDDPGVSRVYDPAGAKDGDYYLSLSDGAHSQQTNPASDGDVITVTTWMRGASNGDQADITIDFRHQGQGGREQAAMISFSETKTLTTSWAQYSFAATAPTDMNPVYGNRVTFTAALGDTVYVDDVAKSIGGGPTCGDETCDPGEDECNCSEDCGTPPSTETNCTDGVDEDCDTYTDCDDIDCDGDPACPTCGDKTCDPGEDQCNCPDDCGTPPSSETTCDDGIDEDCDTYTDCDDSDCDGDPACPDCVPKNGACTDNADCCSGNCRPSNKCA